MMLRSFLRLHSVKVAVGSYANGLKVQKNKVCFGEKSLWKTCITNTVFANNFCTNAKNEYDTTPLTTEEIEGLTNNDPELHQKLKIIFLETEVLRQDGHSVPSNEFIKFHQWKELLKLNTRSARKRYLDYLFKLEKKKENEALKKEQKRIQREEIKEQKKEEITDDSIIKYGLGYNCIMLRIQDATMNCLYNNNLCRAMQYGQKLVIDCGYSDKMTTRENVNCAKQLTLLFAENRTESDCFDLHFCNAKPQSQLVEALQRNIPTMYEKWFPLNIHEESYLDTFQKEKLVYLTPHCRDELTEYDHDAIYIIGGIVDKMNNEPLSMAKAKEEGIQMRKFPLDKYLSWGSGAGKSLTLNQVLLILLDVKKTADWKHALRHVPQRKLNTEQNFGSAIRSYKGLSYDIEKPRNVKVPKPQLTQRSWKPKQEKLVKISSLLKE